MGELIVLTALLDRLAVQAVEIDQLKANRLTGGGHRGA